MVSESCAQARGERVRQKLKMAGNQGNQVQVQHAVLPGP